MLEQVDLSQKLDKADYKTRMELLGNRGLLRSVAVADTHRNQQLGQLRNPVRDMGYYLLQQGE